MDFYVMAKSYNMYGAHTALAPIAHFLMMGADEFGGAVRELIVTLHFRNVGSPQKNLQTLLQQHDSYRSTLPKINYRRAKGRVEIEVASELEEDRGGKTSDRLSLPVFERGVDEVCRALSLMRSRIKPADDFDLDAFFAHCEAARLRIPTTDADLQRLAAALSAAEEAKREAMSSWERLFINWEDFHPKARKILDDPFFWDVADSFAPNGSDTGADLLSAYRQWLEAGREVDPLHFFKQLCVRWGYAGIESMDNELRYDATVGLAFADLKLRGVCDERVLTLAIESIRLQRVQAEASASWPHRAERLEALRKIENKLRQCR
ncbi:hypothetical protein [Hydrogenophaga pseudoflava]|uniref:hypothetical protein n=1 Tax=Hydrogenophaga pseudoflava TaxID=47421 RepID=UPI0027E44B40|nr:hypothetical protein [Hydrogenophaga pseudoflava]MDQ7745092.1 hypothetical protein [Hydrogenophaga pseudoflava]